jgi:hypothetical protein
MADYEPKTEGITYLRHAIIAQKKRPSNKFVTLPMSQAEKIIDQAKGFVPSQSGYDPRRNSERAAALILGLDVKDLVAKLNQPDVAKVLSDLAEAKNYIKMMEENGDLLYSSSNSGAAKQGWMNARKFRLSK